MTDIHPVASAFPAVGKDSRMLRLLPRADMPGDLRCDSGKDAAGRRIFHLDARFEHAGAWAGVRKLVEAAYLGLLEIGADAIVEEHACELYMVLPEYRHRIHPRYLSLTDTAVGIEKTRFYPLERAYRLVHGLVGLVLQWKQALANRCPWVVVVWKFDDAQHLATRFFAELARRGAPESSIEVLVETQSGQSDLAARIPGTRVVQAATWTEPVMPNTDTCVSLDDVEAIALEKALENDPEVILECKYPLLLKYYRDKSDDLAAACLAFRMLSLYNRRGYYHEAKSLLQIILPHFNELVGQEEFKRMNSVSEINSCLIATGDAAQALQVVMDLAAPYITKPHLLANMNYIFAMHHLRYLEAKDVERAEHHILQAVDSIRAAGHGPEASEHAFLKAFIDNGLAFLRVRQKRPQEALDLCEAAYQAVTHEMGEDRHKLHRSVLQYNMAQVYVMLGRLEEGLQCYQNAISMDPFYSEYLVESGNILQQLGRFDEATDYYEKAIKCSPPYPEVYLGKAICHARQEQWLDALTCAGISLDLNPDQPDLHAARAEIFVEMGQGASALAEYDKAIALDPDSVAMRVNRAVLHFNNESYELALADMDEVIARDPDESAHYENRAAIYQATNRRDLYLRDLEMAEHCKEPA